MMNSTEKKLDTKDKTRSDLNMMQNSFDKRSNQVFRSTYNSENKRLTADPRKRPQNHAHNYPPFKKKPLLDGPRELHNL